MARNILRIVAVLLICIAVGVALDQIIGYGGWEWEETFRLYHHESTALIVGGVGVLLGLLSFKL